MNEIEVLCPDCYIIHTIKTGSLPVKLELELVKCSYCKDRKQTDEELLKRQIDVLDETLIQYFPQVVRNMFNYFESKK